MPSARSKASAGLSANLLAEFRFSLAADLNGVTCLSTARPGPFLVACAVYPPGLGLMRGRWSFGEDVVMGYIQEMMRKEPVTFAVMLLMIAILLFGLWDIMHVVKR